MLEPMDYPILTLDTQKPQLCLVNGCINKLQTISGSPHFKPIALSSSDKFQFHDVMNKKPRKCRIVYVLLFLMIKKQHKTFFIIYLFTGHILFHNLDLFQIVWLGTSSTTHTSKIVVFMAPTISVGTQKENSEVAAGRDRHGTLLNPKVLHSSSHLLFSQVATNTPCWFGLAAQHQQEASKSPVPALIPPH